LITSRVLLKPLLFWLLASSVSACGSQSREPSGSRIDTLPNGVIQVQNSEEGTWGPGEEWRLEETLRLGTLLGDGPEVFGGIRDIEIDRLGRIWIYESQAEEIRVFSADGRHVRTFGRPGEGPGEFGNVYALAWSPDDHLWVVDRGLGRVSIFDTAGVFVTSRRRGNPFFASPWPGGIDERGHFYDLESAPFPERRKFLVRYDSALSPMDTIRLPQHPKGPQTIEIQVEGGITTYSKPFAGSAVWSLTQDGGMWVAITDEYRLLRLSPNGDTLRVVTKPFHPVQVTSEERDRVVDGYRRAGRSLSRSQIPDVKPAVGQVLVDDRGNVWVIPVRPGEDTGRFAEVFDPDGVYLGEVELPVPILVRHPVAFREGVLATVTTDSLEVPFVVRFEIRGYGFR
jgi:hypothetical protein